MPPTNSYLAAGLSQIPKILFLCDRNPTSQTYGCFDRSFWHYRTIDFPCGMFQEYGLALALASQLPNDGGNPYHQNKEIERLAIAGIKFANKIQHKDGALDDYFPFEKALGASAFALHASLKTCLHLGYRDEDTLALLKKRVDFVAGGYETGQLSNHEALVLLTIYLAYQLFGDESYLTLYNHKKDHLLKKQTAEGWFPEYEGCDPGYQTATLSFLSQIYILNKDEDLFDPIQQSINFCFDIMHRDGSFAGEYGSRNTYHFFPFGFAAFAKVNPKANEVFHRFNDAIKNGRHAVNDDDRVFCHVVNDYLCAALLDVGPPNKQAVMPRQSKEFPIAGLYCKQSENYSAVVSVKKGGVIKAHSDQHCFLSDTGPTIVDKHIGQIASNFVQDMVKAEISEHEIVVEGQFYKPFTKKLNGIKFLIFRMLNYTVGRVSPNLLRAIIQKLAITNKNKIDANFKRTINFGLDDIVITDRVAIGQKLQLTQFLYLPDQNPIYTAASKSFQQSTLLPHFALSDEQLTHLNRDKSIEIVRRYTVDGNGIPVCDI